MRRALTLFVISVVAVLGLAPAAMADDGTFNYPVAPTAAEVGLVPGQPIPSAEDTELRLKGPAYYPAWPLDGADLWVPIRQGYLRFAEPVRSSAATFTLTTADGAAAGDIERETKGERVNEILFNFPTLSPGAYVLQWQVSDVNNVALTGTMNFSIQAHEAAPGGGNHRHGVSHVQGERPVEAALRSMLVLSAAVVTALATLRRRSVLVEWAARPAWLLAAVTSTIGVVWSLAGPAHVDAENIFGRLASAAFWTWATALVASIVFLLRPRTDRWWSMLVLAAAMIGVAGASHVTYVPGAAVMGTIFAVQMAATSAFLALLGLRTAATFGAPELPAWVKDRRLLAIAVVPPLLGVILTMVYADSLAPVLDHRLHLVIKAIASAPWFAAAAASFFVTGTSRRAKFVSIVAVVVAVVAATPIGALPPGAAGI